MNKNSIYSFDIYVAFLYILTKFLIILWMDLSYLEKALRKIELRFEMISGIAEYCVLNSKGCENEVAKIIDEEYQTHII